VGPDLASVTNRTREDLLLQILDPNAYITPGYEEYIMETTDGRLITGVIAKETATSVTLRRSEGEEDTLLRSNIASLRSSSVSLMPENLETGITLQGMADLLQYLKSLGTIPSQRR
jgi:putative heme-binding domain-containing protein